MKLMFFSAIFVTFHLPTLIFGCCWSDCVFFCSVSRSETSGASQSSNVQFVSEYLKEELLCEGSELCFEEVRAARYFRQVKAQQEDQAPDVLFVKEECNIVENNKLLDLKRKMGVTKLNRELEVGNHAAEADACGALSVNSSQHASGRDQLSGQRSSRRSLGLRLATEPAFIATVAPGDQPTWRNATPDPDERVMSSVLLPSQQVAPPQQEVSCSYAEKILLHEDPGVNAAAAAQ